MGLYGDHNFLPSVRSASDIDTLMKQVEEAFDIEETKVEEKARHAGDDNLFEHGSLHEIFAENEARLHQALIHVRTVLARAQREAGSHRASEESAEILGRLPRISAILSKLDTRMHALLAKGQASYLATWYRENIDRVRHRTDDHDILRFDQLFNSHAFRLTMNLHKEAIETIDHCLASITDGEGELPFSIHSLRLLKEDLAQNYIDYKLMIQRNFPIFYSQQRKLPQVANPFRERMVERLAVEHVRNTKFEKALRFAFRSKIVTSPANIARATLYLAATVELADDGALIFGAGNTMSNPLKISASCITLGFAVPALIYSMSELISGYQRMRTIQEMADQSDVICQFAQHLVQEGRKIMRASDVHREEEVLEGDALTKDMEDYANAMEVVEVGIELEKKAKFNIQFLNKERVKLQRIIYQNALAVPLDLTSIALSTASIISRAAPGLIAGSATAALHWVGVGAGVVGLIFGGYGMYNTGKKLHADYQRLGEIRTSLENLDILEDMHGDDPIVKEFVELERDLLIAKYDKRMNLIKRHWLQLAINIALTIVGILSLAAMFATGPAGGIITIFTLAFTVAILIGASTLLITFRKEDPGDIKELFERFMQGLAKKRTWPHAEIAHYLQIKHDELPIFQDHPRPYLLTHFHELLGEE